MREQKKEKYLGIDIGGTTAKIGLIDAQGSILRSEEYAVDFDGYETPILATVLERLKKFMADCGVCRLQLVGIGVSATGGINTQTGRVDGSAGHIKNWQGSRIKEKLEEVFQIPVYVLNDANAVALGELWLGAARGRKDAVVVTIGTGIGGGIIVDGKPLLGKSGFAGEVGHMIISHGGESCTCGNFGCLERYGSTKALVRRIEQGVRAGEIPGFEDGAVNGRRIFEELEKGNEAVERVTNTWMDYIADGLISLIHIFNPEIVIIGGGVSTQRRLFVDKVRSKVLSRVRVEFAEGLEIVAAELGNQAGMIGAVHFCRTSMLAERRL